MKVVRSRRRHCVRQRLDAARSDVNHVVLILQRTFDQKQRLVHEYYSILVEYVRRHDHVSYSGLVFHAQKQKPFRRSGTLADDHQSGDSYPNAVAYLAKIDRALYPELVQFLAAISHRVPPDRQARASKVGVHPLFYRHRRKRRIGILILLFFEQRPNRTRGAFDLPERAASMQELTVDRRPLTGDRRPSSVYYYKLTVDRRPSTVFNEIQRADFGELPQLVLAKLGDAIMQIVDVHKRPRRAFTHDCSRGFFSKPPYVKQSKPEMRGWRSWVGVRG